MRAAGIAFHVAFYIVNQYVAIDFGAASTCAPASRSVSPRGFHDTGTSRSFISRFFAREIFRWIDISRRLRLVDIARADLAIQRKAATGVFVGIGEHARCRTAPLPQTGTAPGIRIGLAGNRVKLVRIATPGIVRVLFQQFEEESPDAPRFIPLQHLALACCKGI